MGPEQLQPSQLRRAIWVYAAVPMIVLFVPRSDLLRHAWWEDQPMTDIAWIALAAFAGIAVGCFCGRDIWTLRRRNPSVRKVIVVAFISLLVVCCAIALRELELWQWTFAQGDAFMAAWFLTMLVAACLTEFKKSVRVYLGIRDYTFVARSQDA
jgi:hypothetical protein